MSSEAEIWKEAERLFHAAADIPTHDRGVWLRTQTDDPRLLQEVESLLVWTRGSDVADPGLMKAVGDAAVLIYEQFGADPPTGVRIGPYRLISLIGQGGMATVYKAVRDDHFRKEVAIKLVKRGMDSDAILTRFRQERQMLAGLEHPNIARLIDGGIAEDGRSYLVMEYVEGQPLTTYCQKANLSIRQRLELFVRICEAVQYAHGRLIVHRDLKAGNILVTSDGTPKLLDFGIAKWLDPSGDGQQTRTEMRLLTPDYASPEQLRGEPATTVADVYSLGVVLYEILTGSRPWKRKTADIGRVSDTAMRNPAPPSSILSGGDRRNLRGDLDNIVMMALRPEPERRYASVEQFAGDINRYLAGRTVIAHEDSVGYKVSKFLGRNRLPAAAVALALVAAVYGFVVTYQAKKTAERRFEDVRALANTFLFDFYDQIRDVDGATKAREMVVQTALHYLDKLQKEAGADHELLAELATAYSRVATAQGDPNGPSLGHRVAARDSFLKSISLRERAIAADRDSWSDRLALGETLDSLGNLQIALSDVPGALASDTKSLNLVQAMRRERPSDMLAIRLEAQTEQDLGNVAVAQGRVRDTVSRLEHARDDLMILVKSQPKLVPQRTLPGVLSTLSGAQARLGELEKAEGNARLAVELAEKFYAANPQSLSARRQVYFAYQMLGGFLGAHGRPSLEDEQAALKAYQKSLDIAQLSYSKDPNNQSAITDLMLAYGKIGDLVFESDPRRSLEYNGKAFDLGKLIVNDGMSLQDIRGFYWLSTARPLELIGRRPEALQQLRALIADLSAKKPENAPISFRQNLADAYGELGGMEGRAGQIAAGRSDLQRSFSLFQEILKRDPAALKYRLDVADTLVALAQLEKEAGAINTAREYQSQAVETWRGWNQLNPGSAYGQKHEKQAEARLASFGT